MGNNPSVAAETEVLAPVVAVPFLNHAMFSFRPSTSEFFTGFTTSVQPWMFPDVTNLGLVAELGENNWQSRLKSLGALSTEPVWRALDSHFNQQAVATSTGRARISKPDVVYIGRRLQSVISQNTVEFSSNAAGTVRVRVDQAQYIYSGQDPAGSLADVTITADGVLTVTQLAAALSAALNALPDFAAVYTASAALGVVTIVSDVAGFPLIVSLQASSPGPAMILTVTTANVANNYYEDLTSIQTAAEFPAEGLPSRKFYWITDVQGDDVVNQEGMEWVEDQGDKGQFLPIRPYIFQSWSTSGGRAIENLDGDKVGNFDPTSTASAAALAQAANGNSGWTRGSVNDHDRFEFVVPALLGRTIGFLPGEVSFTSKVLFGSTSNSKMSPRDFGDNETLSTDRAFNWYGAEGPNGSQRWGYLANGSFIDRKWLEDYATFLVREALINWMQLKNIVQYSDDDIEAGAGIIASALAQLPAINPQTIEVTFLKRAFVPSNDIALRIYRFYSAFAVTFGIINQIGLLADPIKISLSDS